MKQLLIGHKRSIPLLGTVLRVEFSGVDDLAITKVFRAGEKLESVFNFHDAQSTLSRFNRKAPYIVCNEFNALLELANAIQDISENSFNPYFDGHLDLGGIAKGFIVDRLRALVLKEFPTAFGNINAGGDVGFLNVSSPVIYLRLGGQSNPVLRELSLSRDSVASSSVNVFGQMNSSTRYHLKLREWINSEFTAVVQTDQTAVADALTKVALFSTPRVIENCCKKFNALVLIFDGKGELHESFGPI